MKNNNDFDVWHCKLVIPKADKHDRPTDSIPRFALINACEEEYGRVVSCFSGWGGSLTNSELEATNMSMVSDKAREVTDALSVMSRTETLNYIQELLYGQQ